MADNFSQKNTDKYYCKVCDFKGTRYSEYLRHINTAKHKKMTNADINITTSKSLHLCSCGKVFGHRQSLHRHKKSCNGEQNNNEANQNSQINTSIMDVLLRQQEIHKEESNELKKMLFQQQENHHKQLQQQQEEHNKQIQELIPQLQQVTNINNNTNCNNKFNLNFFLNEQCKDAISIQNFIENLNIGIPELEHMGNVGYVQGMMSIFSNTLGAMDIYKRPLHCTDLKRETLYIKQGDTWKKDTDDKTELKKLIKTVEYKNYKSLRLWEREHPEAFECDTQDNIDYMRISNESLGGFDSTDAIKLGKIMKHVVKEVYIK